jgi:hypothetical protein
MRHNLRVPSLTLQIGEGRVTVRKTLANTGFLSARILGEECVEGRRTIYLDRRLHQDTDSAEGWVLSGPMTTILTEEPKKSP